MFGCEMAACPTPRGDGNAIGGLAAGPCSIERPAGLAELGAGMTPAVFFARPWRAQGACDAGCPGEVVGRAPAGCADEIPLPHDAFF